MSKWAPLLSRWHRRIGVVAALFFMLLGISGILLNHTAELGLARQPIPERLVQWFYFNEPLAQHKRVTIEEQIFEKQNPEERLKVGDQLFDGCHGPLQGVVALNPIRIAACRDTLLIFDQSGLLLDRIESSAGLPHPIDRVGVADQRSVLDSAGRYYFFDPDTLVSDPAPSTIAVEWSTPTTLTSHAEIDWERFLLDIHSGRMLGRWGPLVTDLLAVALITLSIAGVILWQTPRRSVR